MSKPTPTCARHGVEKERRTKGGVGRWTCRECERDAARRSNEKSKVAPNDVVYLDVAASLVGRDVSKFKVLCEELGVSTVKRGSNDVYRMKDVQRIKDVVKERAAAWTRGERWRPY